MPAWTCILAVVGSQGCRRAASASGSRRGGGMLQISPCSRPQRGIASTQTLGNHALPPPGGWPHVSEPAHMSSMDDAASALGNPRLTASKGCSEMTRPCRQLGHSLPSLSRLRTARYVAVLDSHQLRGSLSSACDVTDEASFNNIRNWMKNIEQHASDSVVKVRRAQGGVERVVGAGLCGSTVPGP